MAMLKISILPVGTGATSLGHHIARAVKVLQRESGIKYELTAMGTIIEGDLDRLLGLVRSMHETAFADGVKRVETIIEIDDRRDKMSTIIGKVAAVRKRLEK